MLCQAYLRSFGHQSKEHPKHAYGAMANNLFSDDFSSSKPELKLALAYFWFMHMNSVFDQKN